MNRQTQQDHRDSANFVPRIRIAQRYQKKPVLSEEVKRNLSVIAKSIASKMLTASNPSNPTDQRTMSISDLLSQIEGSKTEEIDLTSKNSKCNNESGFQQLVIEYLVNITESIKELKAGIREIGETKGIKVPKSQTVTNIQNSKMLSEKYSYTIPLPSMEEFERFNQELDDPNSNLRSDYTSVLMTAMDSSLAISKNIVRMMKKFLAKDLALQFTAAKQAKDKKIMKTTTFFSCMEATIREHRNQAGMQTLDKEVIAALSCVMSNASKWHQSRHYNAGLAGEARLAGTSSEHDDSSRSETPGIYEMFQVDYRDQMF